MDPIAVARDVARYIQATISDSAIIAAFSHLREPGLRPDASAAISSLCRRGYTILALPGDVPLAVLSPLDGISYALWDAHGSEPYTRWSDLLDFVQQKLNVSLSADQTLVTTSDLVGIAEAASLAGFPTAFMRPLGSRSDTTKLPTISPTYTLSGLDALLNTLLTPRSAPAPAAPSGEPLCLYRFRGCYQIEDLLGEGTYSTSSLALF